MPCSNVLNTLQTKGEYELFLIFIFSFYFKLAGVTYFFRSWFDFLCWKSRVISSQKSGYCELFPRSSGALDPLTSYTLCISNVLARKGLPTFLPIWCIFVAQPSLQISINRGSQFLIAISKYFLYYLRMSTRTLVKLAQKLITKKIAKWTYTT